MCTINSFAPPPAPAGSKLGYGACSTDCDSVFGDYEADSVPLVINLGCKSTSSLLGKFQLPALSLRESQVSGAARDLERLRNASQRSNDEALRNQHHSRTTHIRQTSSEGISGAIVTRSSRATVPVGLGANTQ